MLAVKRRCAVCHASYTRGEQFCSLDGGAIVADDGSDDELVGKTIDGRYLVTRLLGRGGMGKVYEAQHVGLGKRIAIKVISATDADRDQRARFRQEARAASQIVHEHVVQIFDVGVDGAGRDFIVMEYVDGRDLDELIREGPLPPARAIAIAIQILRGLHASHAAGIVHRDIKPSNIRLADGRDFVKVMDFGIAKSVHTEVAQTDTGTGRVIGTPQFMAPEQLVDGAVDHRADVYAVGVTLYAMLAGASPFASTSFTQRIEMLEQRVPSIETLRDGVPASVAAAIARALERRPEDRFPNALAFADALSDGAAIAEARMDAPTKPMVYPGMARDSGLARDSALAHDATVAASPVRRRRRSWPAVVAVLLLALGPILAFVMTRERPRAAAPIPPPPAPDLAAVTAPVAAGAVVTPVAADAAVDAPDPPPDAARVRHKVAAPPPSPSPSPLGPPCTCTVKTPRGSISNACIQKAEKPKCQCKDGGHNLLCPVVVTVTDGRDRKPDGTKSGSMYCIDRTRPECDPLDKAMPKDCWVRDIVAVHGDPCRGFRSGTTESDGMVDGTYHCSVCDFRPTAPKYRGKSGDPCTGFEYSEGEQLTGVLDCRP